LGDLLSRPAAERAREYRYRFGQSVVFGLPVVALQLWGDKLGGREAVRWAGAFQALLAGWVIYVAAAGMLFEGILLLVRRRVTADVVCAAVALGIYLLSTVRLLHVLFGPSGARPVFHWVILILATWSAVRWWQFSRRARNVTRRPDAR
jgi:cation transport ATPase